MAVVIKRKNGTRRTRRKPEPLELPSQNGKQNLGKKRPKSTVVPVKKPRVRKLPADGIPRSHKKIIPNSLSHPVVYRVRLDAPVGINATYSTRKNSPRIYKSAKAREWTKNALEKMENAGWQSFPANELFRIRIFYELHTIALDVDGPEKLIIDAVKEALGIDDRWVGNPVGNKHWATGRAEQYMDLVVRIDPVNSKWEFTQKSQEYSKQQMKELTDGAEKRGLW